MSLAIVLFIGPLGKDAFVQVQEDSVKRLHLTVEDALHVTVSSKGLLDVTDSAAFRAKLAWLEVVNVFVVVEHESNSCRSAVNLEGMSAQHDTLKNNSIWCTRQKISVCDERHRAVWILTETQNWTRWKLNRREKRSDDCCVWLEESFKLQAKQRV